MSCFTLVAHRHINQHIFLNLTSRSAYSIIHCSSLIARVVQCLDEIAGVCWYVSRGERLKCSALVFNDNLLTFCFVSSPGVTKVTGPELKRIGESLVFVLSTEHWLWTSDSVRLFSCIINLSCLHTQDSRTIMMSSGTCIPWKSNCNRCSLYNIQNWFAEPVNCYIL